jgi:hypothetical protein
VAIAIVLRLDSMAFAVDDAFEVCNLDVAEPVGWAVEAGHRHALKVERSHGGKQLSFVVLS